MKYSINYVHKNSFIKEWARDKSIKTMQDGREVSTGMTYNKANVPKTNFNFCIKYDESQRTMAIDLSQEELNKIVVGMNIFEDGVQLKEAPLGTNNHPFWKSSETNLMISEGNIMLDDEIPRDQLILSGMRMDKKFHFKESNKPMNTTCRWVVTPFTEKNSSVVEEVDESMEAVKLISVMDHSQKLAILKACGKPLSKDADEKVTDAILFKMVTKDAEVHVNRETTNLQMFMKMAKANKDTLNIMTITHESKAAGLFTKKGNHYMYGAVKLGSNMDEVAETLRKNVEVLHELKRKLEK